MRWSLKYFNYLWKLGIVSRLIVTAFILSLFSTHVRKSCKELWPFVKANGTSHLYLAYLVLALTAFVGGLVWFVRRLKRGKGFDPTTILSLVLSLLGILPSIFLSGQMSAALNFARRKDFWQHHTITGVVLGVTLCLWGPVIIALYDRLSVRSELNEALLRASFQHQDHIQEAVSRAAGARPTPLVVRLFAAVIQSYSTAASHLAQYGTEAPLLPGTFDTYAQCVKGILDFVTNSREVKTVSIYTLLKRPIWHWYNPLTAPVNGSGQVGEAAFTRSWWETYKLNVAALKDQSAAPKLTMKRLILQHSPEYSDSDAVSESFYLLTNGRGARKHVEPYSLNELPAVVTKPGSKDMHLLPEIERMVNAHADDRPEGAKVHLIGEYKATAQKQKVTVNPDKWTSLITHFQDAYHSKSVKAEKFSTGNTSGIFYGYIKSIEADFYSYAKNYDDLFLVKIGTRGASQTELFGIAFIDDKTGDEVGIRFLDTDEIKRMGEAFEKQWNYQGTVDKFVFCSEQEV
jgi:hypothetical protein